MFKMTREIKNRLELMGYEVETLEFPDLNGVYIECESRCGTPYSIWFMSTDDENDVGVRVEDLFSNLSKDEQRRVLPLFNDINANGDKKIYCDPDGDVFLSYDFTESCPAPVEYVPEMIADIKRMVDEIMPGLKKAIAPRDTDD